MSSNGSLVNEQVASLCQEVGSTPQTANHADLMLYRHCRDNIGTTPALYYDHESYSYEQIAGVAARCADWLRALGIVPGDRVILSMPDCPTLVALYFGVVAVGAVAIILDEALPREDSFYITQICAGRLIIAYDKNADRLQSLRSLPKMMGVVEAGLTWAVQSEFAATISSIRAAQYTVNTSPNGYAYGLLSSGSTGRPKLIVHRHADILYGHVGFAQRVLNLSTSDCGISVAKMTTGYGLGCSLLMPFLTGASSALFSGPPDARAIADIVQDLRCTLLFSQPRFLSEVVAMPDVVRKLATLRLTITGGEPLAHSLADRWSASCGTELLDSYGNTEVGFLYITNQFGDSRRGSVGKPIDGIRIQITNSRGELVHPGEIGTLRVKGPSLIEGYWNEPQRTRDAFQDGWFVTSDMFSVDADGFYFIHGRADHMIKLGCGDWVNPIELEAVLLEHHFVRECAIVGAQNPHGLTILKALVVTHDRENVNRDIAGELSELIRGRWPRQEYKHVGIIEFTDVLPRTAAGKLDRAKLRSQSMTEFSYKC